MKAKRMNRFTVLMAEDDPDDRFLVEQAFLELGCDGDLRFVEDGEEVMYYLRRSGQYADSSLFPRPALILLDLNMPKKDGRQALVEIKADPDFKNLPIFVLTTSDSRQDKEYCAEFGVSDYVTKPESFSELVALMKKIEAFCIS